MKNLILLAGMILIMPGQCACRTNKLLNRQQSSTAALQQTTIRDYGQEHIQYSRSHIVTDSMGNVYRVTIFPIDTFQFSGQEGFKGKASHVEITGSIRQTEQVNDHVLYMADKEREATGNRISKMDTKQVADAKTVERTGFKSLGFVLAAGALMLIIWLFRRFRKFIPRRT